MERFGFLIARQLPQRNLMPCYFFKSARKLGVSTMPICACLEAIVESVPRSGLDWKSLAAGRPSMPHRRRRTDREWIVLLRPETFNLRFGPGAAPACRANMLSPLENRSKGRLRLGGRASRNVADQRPVHAILQQDGRSRVLAFDAVAWLIAGSRSGGLGMALRNGRQPVSQSHRID